MSAELIAALSAVLAALVAFVGSTWRRPRSPATGRTVLRLVADADTSLPAAPGHFDGGADTAKPVVVVGLANDPGARHALRWAYEAAVANDAVLVVVTAVPLPSAVATVDGFVCIDGLVAERAARALQDQILDEELGSAVSDPRIERMIAPGNAVAVLVAAARRADLLVLGRRRRTLRHLLTPSISGGCTDGLAVPVVILREETPLGVWRSRSNSPAVDPHHRPLFPVRSRRNARR